MPCTPLPANAQYAPVCGGGELEVLLVAHSGLRSGEHAALTAVHIDIERRRITVDRQVVELRSGLRGSLPKGRHRRVTTDPAVTPGGVDWVRNESPSAGGEGGPRPTFCSRVLRHPEPEGGQLEGGDIRRSRTGPQRR
jgi:hypothetical protein